MDKYQREGLTFGTRGELDDIAYGLKWWKDKVHAWMEVNKDNYKNSDNDELEKILEGYKMAEDIVDTKTDLITKVCKMRACRVNVVFTVYELRDIIMAFRNKIKEITDPIILHNFRTIANEFVLHFGGNLDRARYYGYGGGRIYLSDTMKEGD